VAIGREIATFYRRWSLRHHAESFASFSLWAGRFQVGPLDWNAEAAYRQSNRRDRNIAANIAARFFSIICCEAKKAMARNGITFERIPFG
jgi:hypothetical protein